MDFKKTKKNLEDTRTELENWLIERVKDERFVGAIAEEINEAISSLCKLEDRIEDILGD